jgi:hypothetical protein
MVQRQEIEGHHPGQINMGAGGDQIGDVAGSLAAALDDYGLHVHFTPTSFKQSKNVVVVTNESGNVIYSGSTFSLGNGVRMLARR